MSVLRLWRYFVSQRIVSLSCGIPFLNVVLPSPSCSSVCHFVNSVVAMLWSVVQPRKGRVRMVVYVVGSC